MSNQNNSLFVASTVLLFFVVLFTPSLAFADVNTDKSVYFKGELVKISGTLDLQDVNEQVNIVEIEIIDSDSNTIINAYTPVNDNVFSTSYDTITWIPGNYKIIISYNDVEDSVEFEIVSSSSSSDNNFNKESEDNQQDSSSPPLSDTVPDPPIDLKANVISDTQVDLSWYLSDESDTSITGFKIEARTNTDPNYSIIVENTGNDDTTYSHTNLIPDTVYAYRVLAISPAGESEPSSSTTVKTFSNSISSQNTDIENTDVPTDLVAKAVSSTSIELTWNPPTQTYGQIIQGYIIKQEIVPGVYTEIASIIGSDTNHTISDLKTDKSYVFVVAANYLRGATDVSETATVTLSSSSTSNNSNDNYDTNSSFPAPDDVPDRPTDLKIKPVLSTQIDLSWSAPENDSVNNNSITGYKIEVRTANDSSYSTVIDSTESTDTTYSHIGLIPNTTYIYRVYAINDLGTSEPSSENLANTLITDPEKDEINSSSTQDDNSINNDSNIISSSSSTNVPAQPVDLQATTISQNRINLSWSAPIDIGSSPLLGYKIESKTSEEFNYSILVTNTGNPSITSYSHTGLTAGLTYQYRVSAINSFGESMPSDMAEATIVSSDNAQAIDETQSQQSSPTLQTLQITLDTDKTVYGPNDSVKIFGTTNNSSQTIPLGLRVISSDDVIVYARSISIDNDNSFEAIISPLQRQSSVWQINGEFTVEVTYNGRIQETTTFMNNDDSNNDIGNSFSTSNESSNEASESNPQQSIQPSSGISSSINDLTVTSNNELEILKSQNTALKSANQQLQDENNQLRADIEELTKKIENLDMIVKEQMRVMIETLGLR
ncbi:fibronectin type III domain-containing protein [Nitrosopumilus sp.]|uniref:fibronectin type III domain-containing protein n=1 Tax=Nitrosopumilus sp. TaxID=2024843 RepID=UPI003B5AFD69